MAGEQTKAFIETQRKAGKSDQDIFLAMMDSPKFSAGIQRGNQQGHSNRDIALGLGLNLPERKAVDLDKVKKDAMLAEGKKAGPTKAWQSALLGASDLGAGVVQGALYAKDAVFGGDSYKKFTNERKDIENFHDLKRQENNQGFDGWRLGGQIASTAPMAALGRGYQGAKILSGAGAKVAAQNATVGAGIGGASFAGDSSQRMSNTLLGGVGGGVGGVVGEKIGQGVVKATQKAKNIANRFSPEQTNKILQSIDQKLDETLKQNGMSLGELSDEVAKGLREDAMKAFQSGRNLSTEAVARKTVLDKLGIKGTQAQISGNAKQWQSEAELAKVQGAGDKLREKFISDNENLKKLLDAESARTGGNSVDQYGAGMDAAETLLNQHAQNKQFVSAAYDHAKSLPGGDVLINGKGLANDVFTQLDDKALATFLPPDIRNIVNQIEKNPNYFTLRKGEELIKVLNTHYKSSLQNGEPTATTHALGVVRDVLGKRQEEALQGLLSTGGNDAAQAYNFAREAYKANAGLKAKMPMLQDVLKQQGKGSVNYDSIYKQHVINGKVEELAQTLDVLKNTNPQVVANIQQEFIQDLTAKSINSNGQFSPAGMKKALDAFGDRKLNTLFGPEQVQQLKDIRMAGHYLVSQPNHAYVNNSNSAAGLANHFSRIVNAASDFGMKLPFVNRAVVEPIQMASNYRQTANALKGGSIADTSTPITQSQQDMALIDRLVKAGILSGANLPQQ